MRFFKALLFLGSGCVIHALHHEQDMKKMGGIRGMLPFTYLMMIIGTIAITGVGIPGLKLFWGNSVRHRRVCLEGFDH